MNYLLLVCLGIIWGSSYMFIRIAVAEVPPITLVAARLILAAIILWIALRALGRPIPRDRKLWGAYAVMGFLSGALPYVLISWGEQSSDRAARIAAAAFCRLGEFSRSVPAREYSSSA